jgi:hypothetical protein
VSAYNMANVWAAAGDREHTFSWLERAYEGHNPDLIELRAELVFDSLRSDPQLGICWFGSDGGTHEPLIRLVPVIRPVGANITDKEWRSLPRTRSR